MLANCLQKPHTETTYRIIHQMAVQFLFNFVQGKMGFEDASEKETPVVKRAGNYRNQSNSGEKQYGVGTRDSNIKIINEKRLSYYVTELLLTFQDHQSKISR